MAGWSRSPPRRPSPAGSCSPANFRCGCRCADGGGRQGREQGKGQGGRRDSARWRPLLASPPNVAVPRELKAAAGQDHRRAGPPPSLGSAMEEEGEHPAGGRREGGGRGCRRGLRRGARGRPCELRWLALEAPLAAHAYRRRRRPCADPAAAVVAPRGGGRPEIRRPAREKSGRPSLEQGRTSGRRAEAAVHARTRGARLPARGGAAHGESRGGGAALDRGEGETEGGREEEGGRRNKEVRP